MFQQPYNAKSYKKILVLTKIDLASIFSVFLLIRNSYLNHIYSLIIWQVGKGRVW
jgi:hypothetical protein